LSFPKSEGPKEWQSLILAAVTSKVPKSGVNMGHPIRETHGDSLAGSGNQSSGELEVCQYGKSRSPEARRAEVMGHDDSPRGDVDPRIPKVTWLVEGMTWTHGMCATCQ
jgi:hypothetical protein